MARNKKAEEFFEENEQLKLNEEELLDYDYDENADEDEDEEKGSSVGKKLLTVLIVLIALVALFFLSVNLTTLWLDSNEEPIGYETDAPFIDEDDDLFGEDNAYQSEMPDAPDEELEDDDDDKPTQKPSLKPSASPSASPSAKPSATATTTPSPTKTPEAKPTQAPQTTAPTQAPTKTPTPIIPGNPAA